MPYILFAEHTMLVNINIYVCLAITTFCDTIVSGSGTFNTLAAYWAASGTFVLLLISCIQIFLIFLLPSI